MLIRKNNKIDKDIFMSAVSLISEQVPFERMLFFDIETTGLSAVSSFLYLIGCMRLENGVPVLTQFFSEGPGDEPELLRAFTEMVRDCDMLIHFNGQTFDIPYVSAKLAHHSMEDNLHDKQSYDIYKTLKPYKTLLGLDSMKQKSLEVRCGLHRRDMYDGGELIGVYNRYLSTARLEKLRSMSAGNAYTADPASGLRHAGSDTSGALLETLLLHNYEDVEGMLEVCSLLTIPAFTHGDYDVIHAMASENEEGVMMHMAITIRPHRPEVCRYLPSYREYPIYRERDPRVVIGGDHGTITILYPIFTGELKLFHSDYKDYRYIIAEDNAIHKSVADFLDSSLYKKATAATCYSRFSGRFIPIPSGREADFKTVLRAEYRSIERFIPIDDSEPDAKPLLNAYLSML